MPDPTDINPLPEAALNMPTTTPPHTITSVSIHMIVTHDENIREIVLWL